MKLIAHRGNNNHKFKENTKEALLSSLNKPYIDGVECDVRMTKDKKLVLHHDMTINRVSNGSGFIKNKTLRELKKYDFGTKQQPSKITTLKEFLASVTTSKIIIIELKSEEGNIKEFVDKVIKLCKKYPFLFYFCSFRYEILSYIKEKYPTCNVGIIVGNGLNEHRKDEFDFVNIHKNKYTGEIREKFVWTINTKKDIEKFLEKEVYVITDKAYVLKDYGK